MDKTRKVQVLKRDGSAEEFDPRKLAGAMWRAMAPAQGRYGDALDLAAAIRIYLERTKRETISSAAVFEMTVKVLRRVRMDHAAENLEQHNRQRTERRMLVRICDERGSSHWDKNWLVTMGIRNWNLSRAAARIVAARAERELLGGKRILIQRQLALALLNSLVAEFGLADAVPVNPNGTSV